MVTIKSKSDSNLLLSYCYKFVFNVSLCKHILVSILLRLLLIAYGVLHDEISEVKYTDVDYNVVTDGARQVLLGGSPFSRHTYRYSPLLAYMQLPNILIHTSISKILYSSFDIFVAVLIYLIVRDELRNQCRKAMELLINKLRKSRLLQSYNDANECNRPEPERFAQVAACFWLYNPLTAVISTRGNGDSFSSFFVILTIYLLIRSERVTKNGNWLIFAGGLAHGFAIHLRIYPLLFSLAYFLSLSKNLTNSLRNLLRQIFFPSCKQLILVLGTLISLCSLSSLFYFLYGWQYLYEAYLYHLERKDVRHNFSLYFLVQYLGSNIAQDTLYQKLALMMPKFVLFIYISISFAQFRQTLPFCIFLLAFVMVSFNTVVTSQYFVWYLALLPLCLNNLQSLSLNKAAGYIVLWLAAQGFWLFPAYLLEFKTWNTFYWIGGQGFFFFLVNSFLLIRFIENYSFTSFKVNLKTLLK